MTSRAWRRKDKWTEEVEKEGERKSERKSTQQAGNANTHGSSFIRGDGT